MSNGFGLLFIGAAAQGSEREGYLSRISVDPGETIDLFYSSPEPDSTFLPFMDVHGNKLLKIPVNIQPQSPKSEKAWEDGYQFEPTAQFTVPSDLHSGFYYIDRARLIVRNPTKQSDIVIVHPTNTINAYTTAGGKNIYDGPDTASFLRPQRNYTGTYAFDTWMEKQSYDYRYLADSDLQDYSQIAGSKLLVITGGNEYWTREARQNFDRFINEGGNVLVISGNTMNRPVRYDSDTNPTQMIEIRPQAPDKGLWFHPSLKYPVIDSIGGDWYWGGYGTKNDLGWDGWKIVDDTVPYLQDTGLKNGDVLPMPSNEYDGPPILGYDPDTGVPIVNTERLGNYSFKLIGYDRGLSNWRGTDGWGAWYEFQRTPSSGRTIVAGTTDWTSSRDETVHKITAQMFDYLLATATGTGVGDLDHDASLTVDDIEAIQAAIGRRDGKRSADINHDGIIDPQDVDVWVHHVKKTVWGDSNLDGIFDSTDLIRVMAAGKFEDTIDGNSAWGDGDWNSDGDVNSSDFVFALAEGKYEQGEPINAVAAVPEPSASQLVIAVVATLGVLLLTQRRSHMAMTNDSPCLSASV